MIKNDNRRITVTISNEVYKLLKDDAEYEDRSMSNLIARMIKKHYKIKNED